MMKKLIVKLQNWIAANQLNVEMIDDRIFKIGEESFFLIPEKRQASTTTESVFTEEFELNLSEEDEDYAEEIGIKNFCFSFGNNFYYTPTASIEKPKLNILKHIGSSKKELDLPYAFLGMRGRYELCNGTGEYSDWIKKSRFLGVEALAIAEHNTLAGTLPFQLACNKEKMPFILGETISIKDNNYKEYLSKCYVLNQTGWFNLLYINKLINVDNVESKVINEQELLKYGEGLVIVLDSECELDEARIEAFSKAFDKVFYQLDLTQFKGQEKEKLRLSAQKQYLELFTGLIEPILIQDAFYLDSEYAHVKGILNKIGGVKFQNESKDQWYKSLDEIFMQWAPLFGDEDSRLFDIFTKAVENTTWVSSNADFEIETGVRHLPRFIWDDPKESNDDLFFRLIGEGMTRLGLDDKPEYWERIEKEVEVIQMGKVVDYFLILWDIVEWCKTKDILTGVGRGSAAGCLISYVLGITGIDPIEYGLLFERFLNKGRVQTSLPDIDTDFEGKRRDEVKRYMEEKYGVDFVCSVGTYGTFKLKSAIKDIGKQFGLQPKEGNYITSIIGKAPNLKDDDFLDLFRAANGHRNLKQYIFDKPHVIDSLRIILTQPKTASIHPCATLVLPKEDQHGNPRNIYNWLPVKSVDGVLVSEWEGNLLEDAGFLKEDILGIKQLDKFRSIFNKIKKNKGQDLTMASVDLEDPEVFRMFQLGHASDVFHFGSKSLTSYGTDVQPCNTEEMIAMLSLYRPGPIESGAHTDFVKYKFGEKQPESDFMLEDVTKETYGLYIYQEQVMKAVQQLGGMDLVTADNVRKAMGKKNMTLLQEYKAQFVDGAKKNGCDEIEAETIWNKLEAFAKYGFNKSHAAAYTYTGIMCQWLKVNYPLEFWTSSFEFADDDTIPRYVNEVSKLDNGVSVVPPDINKSHTEFTSDVNTGRIYWSISKIKFVGETATECIMSERTEGGEFFSIEEFYERVNTTKVNKRVIENLILAGCFDEMENIQEVKERKNTLKKFYEIAKTKPKDQMVLPDEKKYNWYWSARQKEVSGLGHFDFEQIVLLSDLKPQLSMLTDPIRLQANKALDTEVLIGGLIVDMKLRKTKKGDEFCAMIIEMNDEEIHYLLWPDAWAIHKEAIENSEMKMFLGTGTVKEDSYKNCNAIQSSRSTKVQVF